MTHSAILKRLEAGEVTLAFAANELQLTVDETRLLSRAYRLLREDAAERRREVWRWAKVVALFAVLPVSFTAWAASPMCSGPLSSLYCFQSNAPANANEVNANFATLGNAVVNKTGALSGANIEMATGNLSLTTGSISMPAGSLSMPAGTISFGSTTRQMINLWSNSYGIGVHPSALFNRVPATENYRWYGGGTGNDTVGTGGTAQWMSLNSSGLNVGHVQASSIDVTGQISGHSLRARCNWGTESGWAASNNWSQSICPDGQYIKGMQIMGGTTIGTTKIQAYCCWP